MEQILITSTTVLSKSGKSCVTNCPVLVTKLSLDLMQAGTVFGFLFLRKLCTADGVGIRQVRLSVLLAKDRSKLKPKL